MPTSPSKAPGMSSPSRKAFSALSLNSPSRSQPTNLFPSANPSKSTTSTTTRKTPSLSSQSGRKRNTSPSKLVRAPSSHRDEDDHSGVVGRAPSRRGSPVKGSSGIGLAAMGGVGRNGMVTQDWEPPVGSTSHETRRSPTKKAKNVRL